MIVLIDWLVSSKMFAFILNTVFISKMLFLLLFYTQFLSGSSDHYLFDEVSKLVQSKLATCDEELNVSQGEELTGDQSIEEK